MPAEIVIHKCVTPGSRFAGSLRSRADLPQNLISNEKPPVSSRTGSTTGSNWFEHSFRLWSGHLFDPERVSRPTQFRSGRARRPGVGDGLRSEHFAVKPRRSRTGSLLSLSDGTHITTDRNRPEVVVDTFHETPLPASTAARPATVGERPHRPARTPDRRNAPRAYRRAG